MDYGGRIEEPCSWGWRMIGPYGRGDSGFWRGAGQLVLPVLILLDQLVLLA